MIKNKKTYYQLILDKSGSMNDCVPETLNGFNEQMQMIRSLQVRYPEQEFFVSLTTFNHNVDFDVVREDPKLIGDLVSTNRTTNWSGKNKVLTYKPNGMTALYDAIGMSIKSIQNEVNSEITDDIATVVVVIITDGHENASQKYSFQQIQSIIKELEQHENWTFSFLSNTPDAIEYATRMNIKKMNAFRYDKRSMKSNYDKILNSMPSYFEAKQQNKKEKNFIKNS